MGWLYLTIGIVVEVGAGLSLRMAAHGRPIWYIPMTLGYATSFIALMLTLHAGFGIGVAYGIWAAAGVALMAVAARVLFDEPLTPLMWTGIALVSGGVLLVDLGGI
ncbi:SMR family transporter [Nocardioides sp. CER19]|uniref:DMT family transporter n=1 Tax=Nocardioides sp. CER19 TaxID=3038538 RepID=UPI00244AB9C5|nr:SMR family transporter [Nocardioides sp. CER19]MDH2416144.1 SMR family transporter [Nocardioides sp. CER19]